MARDWVIGASKALATAGWRVRGRPRLPGAVLYIVGYAWFVGLVRPISRFLKLAENGGNGGTATRWGRGYGSHRKEGTESCRFDDVSKNSAGTY